MSDVDKYTAYKQLAFKDRQFEVKQIEPLDYEGATLLYIINYEKGGWEIISADKRTQVVLACSDEGSFSIDCDNENMIVWINTLGVDVLNARTSKVTKAAVVENANVDFWNAICNPEKKLSTTRVISDPEGYLQLVDVTTTIDTVLVDHLLETHWNQDAPWNQYVPLKSISTTERCPAGCVAIAAAQMLYYLHGYYGVPAQSMTQAYCYGDSNNHQMGQSNPSPTAWDTMCLTDAEWGLTHDDKAAILIANVGLLVGMDYGDEESGAETSDLPSVFSDYFGISCSFSDYNSNTVMTQIRNNKPVIMRANSRRILWGLWYSEGHAWVADGCRTITTRTVYKYLWTGPTTDPNLPAPQYVLPPIGGGDTYVYDTVTTQEKALHMNWGWDINHNNYDAPWFAPDGSWVANPFDESPYNFQYNREMITGFIPTNY